MSSDDTFFYFAYGSNLSKARIHINNPSAKFHAVAKLQDYKLIFARQANWQSIRWHGGAASIEQTPGEVVWGVVWTIDNKDMPNLDKQEFRYKPINVTVATSEDHQFSCRTYQMIDAIEDLTSPQYKKVITTGATESGLPADYLELLNNVKDNGYDGDCDILDEIGEQAKKGQKKD